MNGGPGGKRPMGPPRKMNFGTLKRVIKLLFSYYPVLMPLTLLCIIFSAGVSAISPIGVCASSLLQENSDKMQTEHKSTAINFLMVNLSFKNGWKTASAAPHRLFRSFEIL